MSLSLTMVPKDLYYVERKLVAAQAAEIARLRGLVESFEEILTECENDFHRCERCDHQDDSATKESDLFILLRAAIKEQGGSGVQQSTSVSCVSTQNGD